MGDICIHEMDPATCAVCTPPETTYTFRPVITRGAFEVQHPGSRCEYCDEPLKVGTTAAFDGDGEYVCEVCRA